jgi:hypothetical protein
MNRKLTEKQFKTVLRRLMPQVAGKIRRLGYCLEEFPLNECLDVFYYQLACDLFEFIVLADDRVLAAKIVAFLEADSDDPESAEYMRRLL